MQLTDGALEGFCVYDVFLWLWCISSPHDACPFSSDTCGGLPLLFLILIQPFLAITAVDMAVLQRLIPHQETPLFHIFLQTPHVVNVLETTVFLFGFLI